MDTGSLYVAASYFEGEDTSTPHPLNHYKVNEAEMKVTYNVLATELNAAKGVLTTPKQDDECDVQVVCHGRSPNLSAAKTRALRLRFEKGSWKVIAIQYIVRGVVAPFQSEDVPITKDEFDREQNYRHMMREDFPSLGFRHKLAAKKQRQPMKMKCQCEGKLTNHEPQNSNYDAEAELEVDAKSSLQRSVLLWTAAQSFANHHKKESKSPLF